MSNPLHQPGQSRGLGPVSPSTELPIGTAGYVLYWNGTAWIAASLATAGIAGAPASSTDEAIARFNGTAGALQNSGVKIDDTNNVTMPIAALLKFIDALSTIRADTSGVMDIYSGVVRIQLDNKGDALIGADGFMIYPEIAGNTPIGGSGTEYGPIFILQNTVNTPVYTLKTAQSNSDNDERLYQAAVNTTGATVTTLQSLTIPATTTYMIEAHVIARRTGGASGTAEDGAGYVLRGVIKNVAGTATIIGAVAADFTAESVAGYDATIDVTGATARVRVTGIATTDITWHTSTRVWRVTN